MSPTATTIKCALTDKHCDDLNVVLRDSADVAAYCDKCAEAGLPVQQFKDVLTNQAQMAAGIKRVFFPLRP